MTIAREGLVALTALVLGWTLPLVAVAQEGDTTTTTVEIEISATSITSTTEGEADTAATGGSNGPDDTLPFTGSSPQEMVKVAYLALGAGVVLVAITRRERQEGAKTD